MNIKLLAIFCTSHRFVQWNVCRIKLDSAQTADNGKTYNYKFYSLSAIIAVGYRVNSEKATQFRQWATKVLAAFTKQGYVPDQRMDNLRVLFGIKTTTIAAAS